MDKGYKKAIIKIEGREVLDVQEKESKPSVTESKGLSTSLNVTAGLKAAAKTQIIQTEGEASAPALNNVMSNLGGKKNMDTEQFEVQFNPKELSINAGASLSKEKTGVDKKRQNIDYGLNSVKVHVTIPLIFDATREEETSRKDSQKNSGENQVEKSVNQFLKAVRNPNARTITFSWGNQKYRGELYSVSVNYTMFSEQGRGIRATVSLSLLCDITARDIEQSKENLL